MFFSDAEWMLKTGKMKQSFLFLEEASTCERGVKAFCNKSPVKLRMVGLPTELIT